ncbi:AraC family transcriptional regulator [Nocardia sp. NPDC003963]
MIDEYQGRMSCDTPYREDFRGTAVRQRTKEYQSVLWKAKESIYRRTEKDIRAGSDPGYRFIFPLTGRLHFERYRDNVDLVSGSAVFGTAAEPFEMSQQDGTSAFVVTVPTRNMEHHLGSRLPITTQVEISKGLGRVVGDMVRALFEERESLTHAYFDASCDRLVELLCMIIIGEQSPKSGPGLGDVETSLRRYIRQHAVDPTLDGQAVATALGWSLRYVQYVLQQSGTTPRRLIREERLRVAHTRLQDPESKHITITQLAEMFGFSSVGAFSNAYSEYFGHRPSDTRQ